MNLTLDLLRVLVLSIVEGVTEFLPISSTGHLILVNEFVKLEPEVFSNAFNVIIQLGAIMAVVVLYFGKLNPFRNPNSEERIAKYQLPKNYDAMNAKSQSYYRTRVKFNRLFDGQTVILWTKVIIGLIPAAVLGFLFDDWIDAHLFNVYVVATTLVVWGIFIILIERRQGTSSDFKMTSVDDIGYKTAFLIGCFQCMAMVPGTSRSAATIIGAMLLGTSRVAAADFSFFLAIPTMLGATLLKVVKNSAAFSSYQWLLILAGMVLSFLVALFVIRKFLSYIQKNNFVPFGYYRIVFGLIVVVFFTLVKTV